MEASTNSICCLFGLELLICLFESIIFHSDFVSELPAEIKIFSQKEGSDLLLFEIIFTILVYIDERVGSLCLSNLATKCFLHDNILSFHADTHVIKPPPSVLLAVLNK